MMRADNLFKTFNPGTPLENPVLRGLSLTIESGQFVTVIGSNGAGKSTFLNAISGDISPDTGSLFIDGQDVTRQSAWQRAALVARVFQDPLAGTCEGLTIEENLALAMQRGQGRGLSRASRPVIAKPSATSCPPSSWAWKTAWATAWACCPVVSARPSAC
jgi:putative ABC transport system ATP-binding protein